MKLIPLTRGEVAIVDDEDFELVSRYKWQCWVDPITGGKYAQTRIMVGSTRKTIRMHRLILWHASEQTDHADTNGLNNQKNNLRPATRTQNQGNRKFQKHSAPYKGVHQLKSHQAVSKWQACIGISGKKRHLGTFSTAREAAAAYDNAAIKYFGNFARTNQQIGLL